jgi:hypothetical protein
MPELPSIVSSSILDAVDGQSEDDHSTPSTQESTLFINPLMGLYWVFVLWALHSGTLYLDRLCETETFAEGS